MVQQYYVIGDPIAHSLSPFVHGEFAKQCDYDIQFDKKRVAQTEVAAVLQQFLQQGVKGCAVTVPNKQVVMQNCDVLSPHARATGAVNCIKFDRSQIWGENFDGMGLVQALQHYHHVPIAGKRILLLGAGGAVQGVLPPLIQANPKAIVVANRTAAKATQLVAQIMSRCPGDVDVSGCGLSEIGGEFDLVINGTSAGLDDTVPDIAPRFVQGAVCYDMLYARSSITAFCNWAKRHGCAACYDGLGMLIALSAVAFRWWTGLQPDGTLLFHSIFDKERQHHSND